MSVFTSQASSDLGMILWTRSLSLQFKHGLKSVMFVQKGANLKALVNELFLRKKQINENCCIALFIH